MKTGIVYALAPIQTPAFRLPSQSEWQALNAADQDFLANVEIGRAHV